MIESNQRIECFVKKGDSMGIEYVCMAIWFAAGSILGFLIFLFGNRKSGGNSTANSAQVVPPQEDGESSDGDSGVYDHSADSPN